MTSVTCKTRVGSLCYVLLGNLSFQLQAEVVSEVDGEIFLVILKRRVLIRLKEFEIPFKVFNHTHTYIDKPLNTLIYIFIDTDTEKMDRQMY